MLAVHTFWSKPCRIKNHDAVVISDIEMLVLVLSALEWKKHNGTIIMVTDTQGLSYFEEHDILDIWDDCRTDMDDLETIDPFSFWAAGKLYALKLVSKPCVMLDTDMIIWKNIRCVFNHDIVVAHKEDITDATYPNPLDFIPKPGKRFHLPKEWDFSLSATNTAFLYIEDAAFAAYYVESAFEWMDAMDTSHLSPIQSMCFAEQRLLPVCAKAKHKTVVELLDYHNLDQQDFCTHLWGAKKEICQSEELNDFYCRQCMLRLENEYLTVFENLCRKQRFRRYCL